MANRYVNTLATGAGDGTSWDDAYTTIAALESAGIDAGDTIYLNAPSSAPFEGTELSLTVDNLTCIGDAGPSGETWFSGPTTKTGSWSNPSGTIYSIAHTGTPLAVCIEYGPDDADGTVTGVNVNGAKFQTMLERHPQWDTDDCRAWYGWLKRNTGTPTSPGTGEWGVSGSVLYINTGSALSAGQLATVQTLDSAYNAIACSGDNISVAGIKSRGFVTESGNAGYTVKFQGGNNGEARRILSIDCGKHAVGAASDSDTGFHFYDCLSVGGLILTTDEVNPYVHYVNGTSASTGDDIERSMTRMLVVGCSAAGIDGAPLNGSLNAAQTADWGIRPAHAHTDGSIGVVGLDCEKVDGYSFLAEINTKHSLSIDPLNVLINVARDQAASTYGFADWTGVTRGTKSTYPYRVIDCWGLGGGFIPDGWGGGGWWERCIIDGTGRADPGSSISPIQNLNVPITGNRPMYGWMQFCAMSTGDYDDHWMRALQNGIHSYDWYFNLIMTQSTATDSTNAGIVNLGSNVADDDMILGGNVFVDSEAGNPSVFMTGSGAVQVAFWQQLETIGYNLAENATESAFVRATSGTGTFQIWGGSNPWSDKTTQLGAGAALEYNVDMADAGITAASASAFDPEPGDSYAPADQTKTPLTGSFEQFVGQDGLNGRKFDGTPGPYQYGRGAVVGGPAMVAQYYMALQQRRRREQA